MRRSGLSVPSGEIEEMRSALHQRSGPIQMVGAIIGRQLIQSSAPAATPSKAIKWLATEQLCIANCEARAGSVGPRPHRCQSTPAVCFSERESTRQLNGSTGYRGSCDLTDAWVRSLAVQRGWIEIVAGICEARMIEEVDGIYPNLHFA